MRIAIVGFGPRGLAAAESALLSVPDARIDLFDTGGWPAAGPNFAPDEAAECLLNMPARDVDIPSVPELGIRAFQDWLHRRHDEKTDPDAYLPRAVLGAYLSERKNRLMAQASGRIRHIAQAVIDAKPLDEGWVVATAAKVWRRYDAVLLTLGQPLMRDDEQITRWRDFAMSQGHNLTSVYPGSTLAKRARDWAGKTVAIRGLGLSTLDAIALLTLGQGGRIISGRYQRSGREPVTILPFSLDGLPPTPKPLMAVERRFALTGPEHETLAAAIRAALDVAPDTALTRITQALAGPARRMATVDPQAWLDAETAAPGSYATEGSPTSALRDGISMACGSMSPSVAYSVGQIWRQMQDELRLAFRTVPGRDDARSAILGFDAGLKRLTYGPPVQTAQLLSALVEVGIVRLTLADDPAIGLHPSGWRLEGQSSAQVMIDAVLPAARLDMTEDPLLIALRRRGLLTGHPASGGIRIGQNGEVAKGLSVLGRLTEGSCIATDSIHDCFGDITRGWAAGLARLHAGAVSARP